MPEVASLKAVLSANTNQFEQAMNRSQRRMEETTKASKRLMTSVGLMAGAMTGLGIAAVRLAGKMEQSRMGFETMLGSAQKADKFLRDLANFAAKTPFEFFELQNAARRMMAYGFAAEQVIPTLRILGDATAALGGSSEMIDRVTVALGQMQAKGVVSAQEIRQLAEAGIPAWEFLADAIGVSIPEAMKLAEQRAIASSDAIPAILAGMNDKFSGLMARMQDSVVGKWSNMMDQLTLTGIAFGEDLVETFHLKEVITAATGALESLRLVFEDKGLKGIWEEQKQGVTILAGAIAGMLTPAILNLSLAFGRSALLLAPWAVLGALVVKVASDMGVSFNSTIPILGRFARVLQGLYNITRGIADSISALVRGTIDSFIERLGLIAQAQAIIERAEQEAIRNPFRGPQITRDAFAEIRGLLGSVSPLSDEVADQFVLAGSRIEDGWFDVVQGVIGTLDDAQAGIQSNFDGIVESVTSAASGLTPSMDDLTSGFANVGDGAGDAAGDVDNLASSIDGLTDAQKRFNAAYSPFSARGGSPFVRDPNTRRAENRRFINGQSNRFFNEGVTPFSRRADPENLGQRVVAAINEGFNRTVSPFVNRDSSRGGGGIGRLLDRQAREVARAGRAAENRLRVTADVLAAQLEAQASMMPAAVRAAGQVAFNNAYSPFRRRSGDGGTGALFNRGVSPFSDPDRGDGGVGDLAFNNRMGGLAIRGRREDGHQLGQAAAINAARQLREEAEARQRVIEKLTIVSADDGPLGAFGKTLLSVASEQIPALGAALQGFAQGGPIGAISAVFGELLQVMTPFTDLIKVITVSFKGIAEVLGKVLAPVFRLIGGVVAAVANVFIAIANLFGANMKLIDPSNPDGKVEPEPEEDRAPRGGAFGIGSKDTIHRPQVALTVGRSNAAPSTSTALINVADMFGVHVESFGEAVDRLLAGSNRFARNNGGL